MTHRGTVGSASVGKSSGCASRCLSLTAKGCIPGFVSEYPELFDDFRLVVVEEDGGRDYQPLHRFLWAKGFRLGLSLKMLAKSRACVVTQAPRYLKYELSD